MNERGPDELNLHWYRRTERGARGPIAAFMPLAVMLLSQLLMLQSFPAAWGWMTGHPWAALLTYFTLLLVELVVERLTTRLLAGVLLILVPCFLLAMASHLKMVANGAPLLISDLTMIGQAAELTGFLSPEMGIGSGSWLAILLAVGFLFLTFLWDRPVGEDVRWRRLGTAGCLALALSVLLTAPSVYALLDDGIDAENQSERNERLGVLAGMYAAARHNAQIEPDEYNEENMNRILLRISADAPRVATPEVKPNVVLIMSESFYDPTRLPNVTYSTDPLPNYHALAKEFPAGPFLTSAYAGGTGNVEMEILTGICSIFPEGGDTLTTISAPDAYERIPSIVKAFASQGYHTTYIHSHTNVLYGRTEHMPALGFETIRYREDFTVDTWYDGIYISDDCWADQMIYEFEHKEEGQPIFLYGLNMQNHQPYRSDKFEDPSPVEITTDLLEGEPLGMFDSMIHGLYDADAALGKLIDYFSGVEEPTIVVFVGDHLSRPVFRDEPQTETLYDVLKYSTSSDTLTWSPEELKYMLSTNFLVWNNYGAELDVPEELSATGLGTRMLGWAKLPKPLYYSWMDTVLKGMRIYRDRLFVDADGNPTHNIPKEYETMMKRYRTIVYDIIYGEQYAAEAMTGAHIRQTITDTMPEVVAPPPDDYDEPEAEDLAVEEEDPTLTDGEETDRSTDN